MFQQIGIKNLRVGGNTTDTPGIEVPRGDKIDRLFGFTRAAGVKVIYTLRGAGGEGDPVGRSGSRRTLIWGRMTERSRSTLWIGTPGM